MKFADGYYSHHPMVDYFNAMDPALYGEGAPGDVKQDVKLGINEIGMSVPMGISAGNVSGIYSKIRMGTGAIEIQFPGAFHGQRQAQTPEMYGQDQRQAIRELGLINEVKFTTHASMNVMGMMGQDQQGNFSLTRAKMAENEVKRAIEFAADTAGGGSVVVHTGEFERPLTHIYPEGYIFDEQGNMMPNLSRDHKTGRLLFKRRLTEGLDYQFQLLDDRTGQVHTVVQGDRLAAQPVWLRSEKDESYLDKNGKVVHKGDYINYEGDLIEDPYDIRYITNLADKSSGGRVPKYDLKSGRFETHLMHHDDFEREALEYNKYYERVTGHKPDYWDRVNGREMFLKATLFTQAGHSRGWALQWASSFKEQVEALEKLEKLKEFYQKLDKNLPEEEKWKIMKQDTKMHQAFSGGLLPPETKHPLEMIEDAIRHRKIDIEYARQASSSQELQAADTIETMRHLRMPEKYMQRRSIRSYANLGIKAMEETKDTNNPIVVCMENIFPEKFGGHPQELKYLIKIAREKMVNLLTNPKFELSGDEGEWMKRGDESFRQYWDRHIAQGKNPYYRPGVSKEEAEKLAERHIKATLDTGHLNIWRKFYQYDQKKSREENEADFKKWYLNQVEDLAKEHMVGNVHLADNYGYQDDHLAPGQGNAPIKEAVAILKKYGYDRAFTVEPGADASTDLSDFHGLMKTWRHFGSPIYGVGMQPSAPQNWADVQYSYFGQNKPPYFIFGSYSPSNDWTLWSAVPME